MSKKTYVSEYEKIYEKSKRRSATEERCTTVASISELLQRLNSSTQLQHISRTFSKNELLTLAKYYSLSSSNVTSKLELSQMIQVELIKDSSFTSHPTPIQSNVDDRASSLYYHFDYSKWQRVPDNVHSLLSNLSELNKQSKWSPCENSKNLTQIF